MNKRLHNCVKIFCVFLIISIWFIVLVKAFSRLELNSDMAGMVIEANEMLSGNFFLNGRYFTGLTFFPTDLLFFLLGALFFGMSGKAYIMAETLMYFASGIAALLIIYDIHNTTNILKKKNCVFLVLCFLLFSGFPSVAMCTFGMVHQGCFAWCLYAVYFLNKVVLKKRRKNKKYYIAAAIFMIMACMGDSLAYVAVIIPIIIFSVIKIIQWLYEERKQKLNSFYWITIVISAGAAIFGKILNEIYISVGNADLNAYIGSHKFIDFTQLRDKFILFINGISQMLGAYFCGGTVSSADALTVFAKFFLVIAIIVTGILFSVKCCVRGGVLLPENYSSVVLSLGFMIISTLMLFTDFSVDIYTTRYFCYLPFLMTIWLSTWLSQHKFSVNKTGKTILIVICLVFIIKDAMELIFDANVKWFSFEPSPTGQEEMVDKLQELGLKNGFSEFWDANYSTVQSKGSVKVNAIGSDGTFANVFYWFCNPDDYKEYANFVIAGETLQQETVQNIFGTPQLVEEVAENKKIMVYDYDLSKAIRFIDEEGNWSSEIDKENIYACLSFTDACHNESSYNENGTRYLSQGGFFFGPYISLQAGTYEVEIIGDGLDKAEYRAYTWDSDNYMLDVVEMSQNKCTFTVHVDKPTERFEFSIENGSDELIELRQMFIR